MFDIKREEEITINIKYQEVQNLENISALTDKMVVDDSFMSQFVATKVNIDEVIKDNGFELTGQFRDVFFEFVDLIRVRTNELIQAKAKEYI